jgi:hypothetical protein
MLQPRPTKRADWPKANSRVALHAIAYQCLTFTNTLVPKHNEKLLWSNHTGRKALSALAVAHPVVVYLSLGHRKCFNAGRVATKTR